jgi:8-oxo-dGTP diphosphatase
VPASDQGINLDRYMLVPRTLIFLKRGERVLLLKGIQKKRLFAGLYNGVGGHIEPGEDVFTSACRELSEETGLASPNISLCGILTIDTGKNPGVCVFIFTGDSYEGEPHRTSEGNPEWIKFSEIGNISIVSDLPVLLPKIIDFKPGSQIFYAHSVYDENENLIVKII